MSRFSCFTMIWRTSSGSLNSPSTLMLRRRPSSSTSPPLTLTFSLCTAEATSWKLISRASILGRSRLMRSSFLGTPRISTLFTSSRSSSLSSRSSAQVFSWSRL